MEFQDSGDTSPSMRGEDRHLAELKLKVRRLETSMKCLQQMLDEEKIRLNKQRLETEQLANMRGVVLPPSRYCELYSREEESTQGTKPASAARKFTVAAPALPALPGGADSIARQLQEIDELCKREMARVSESAKMLGPLNQIASDWEVQELEKANKESVRADGTVRSFSLRASQAEEYTLHSGTSLPYHSPIQELPPSKPLEE